MARATSLVTIPILPTSDFDETAAFCTRLGFAEGGRWDEYLIMGHASGIELHFWAKGPFDPLKNDVAGYGLLEFALIDPHANLIRIGGSFDGTA